MKLRPALARLSLRWRVLLVLLLALLAVQLLSFAAVGWLRGLDARHLANALIAGDLVRVHTQLQATPADQRTPLMGLLDRAGYRWALAARTAVSSNAPHDAQLADLVRAVVQVRPGTPPRATVWQLWPALRWELDASTDLVVYFPDGLGTSRPSGLAALVYVLAVTAAVTLVAWLAVSLATRPLASAAAAARRMSLSLPGPALDERGPPEVRELARALNLLREEVRQQLQARTQILAAVSHDLKTPITRMQLRVAALPDGSARSRLQGDLDAMAALVAEGLAFAGSETLREPFVSVDLNAVIENLLEPLIDLGHECHYRPSALPPVKAAPQALSRLLQNLVDNALRYGDSVDVQAHVHFGEAGIDVADRGPGLPTADLERMFQPFLRGDASRGRDLGGTGLGLSIARNLAQAHGGRLWLEPRPGGGLVARLRWPGT
jgi:protein-histidine pros-kinase